jgi:hypothetical protein
MLKLFKIAIRNLLRYGILVEDAVREGGTNA